MASVCSLLEAGSILCSIFQKESISEVQWDEFKLVLNPRINVRTGRGRTQTHREQSHMTTEAGMGERGCGHQPRDTSSPQEQQEAEAILSWSLRWGEHSPLTPALRISGFWNAVGIHSCCFKPVCGHLFGQPWGSSTMSKVKFYGTVGGCVLHLTSQDVPAPRHPDPAPSCGIPSSAGLSSPLPAGTRRCPGCHGSDAQPTH